MRTSYTPGTFCWVDLATPNPVAAKAFYNELFGWEAEDVPAGEAGVYTMLSLDGDVVCGLYEMSAEQGASPYWLSYVSVEDAESATAKARGLGGRVLEEAFDIEGSGRIAVISDPEGAILPLWQPGAHAGASRVNDPGCFTWNELQTREPKTAATFYSKLFGWETERIEEAGEIQYVTVSNAGAMNGGMMPMPQEGIPPYWLPYFTVESCEASVEKIGTLNGTVLAGPMDIGAGWITVASDPQGATFALFEGEVDD